MRSRSSPAGQPLPAKRPLLEKSLGFVVAAGAAVLPLFYSAGADGFRLPKELLYRAEGILVIAITLTALLLNGMAAVRSLRMPKALALFLTTMCAWALIAALMSTNKSLTASALSYVATALVVFAATFAAVGSRSIAWLLAPVALGAIPNSFLAVLQAMSVWNPFHFTLRASTHMLTVGLLGNPNDVGSYLMLVTVLMVTAALATKQRVWWILAAVTISGIIASGALTAMIALSTSLAVVAVLALGRKAWIAIVILAAVAIATVLVLNPLRARMLLIRESLKRSDYPVLTSGRIFSFGAAWMMFTDHPLTGVGPGAFKFRYLAYRKDFDEQHPQWYLKPGAATNFAEVHCDHLQVLAEEGTPGYIILLAGLVLLGLPTFRQNERDYSRSPRRAFVHFGALPMAAGLAVLMLAAFPLELAAATQVILHGAAAMMRWQE